VRDLTVEVWTPSTTSRSQEEQLTTATASDDVEVERSTVLRWMGEARASEGVEEPQGGGRREG
jgi:hypothetical protein